MSGPGTSWERELRSAARSFDWRRIEEIADGYVQHLRAGQNVSLPQARAILGTLREHLRYEELLRVADALIGQGVQVAFVWRQLALGLADRERPAAALLIFQTMLSDPQVRGVDRLEALGGIGRCRKQLAMLTTTPQLRVEYLRESVQAYRAAYEEDPGQIWQGINVVALLARAGREGIGLEDGQGAVAALAEARSLAARILDVIESDPEPDGWDLATACEACLALDRPVEAIEWLGRFIDGPDPSAFKLSSFLRQLVQVWQLETDRSPGRELLPVLQSALAQQAGGAVLVATPEVRHERLSARPDETLERVLGTVRYASLNWYRTGLARCRAVARIETSTEDGIGTGFLIRGPELHPDLPERVLVTNGHVVPEALAAQDAVVVFHGLDLDDGQRRRFRVTRRWWYEASRSPHLDTTVLELDGHPEDVEPVPPATRLPNLDARDRPRAYVIGHPRGLEQPQFSLQDNVLLDHDATLVHYRSPTEPGSSGSPVFDRNWRLIGVHHAGGFDMPRLRNQGGTYAANEAISVTAIVERLRERPPAPQEVRP